MAVFSGRSFWLRAEGLLLVMLGVGALAAPLMAGLAVTLVVAWILILTGVIGLISAVAGRAHANLGWSLASALVALIIGVVLFVYPLAGAVGLSLVVGAYLLLDGVALLGLALDHRRRAITKGLAGWGWLAGSGVLDLVLAAAILLMGAVGSAELIGVVVGLSLIAAGVALLLAHANRAPVS